MLNTNLKKQSGFTLVELGIALTVTVLFAMFAIPAASNLMAGSKKESAYQEVLKIKSAANAFRSSPARAGSYKDITIPIMKSRGYNVMPIQTGVGDNTYGLNSSVTATNSNTDATITYELGVAADCAQLIERFTGVDGVKGTPSCSSSGLLTMIIE